ncbi:MAG: aspartate kinase [Peptostreptococcaceae bacterium]|nr:aspartate kinase [Peptostreptococcaceae bacterium]
MGVKVTKFGGSSVADAIQIAKTRDIIVSDPDRKYIIVSAPGKRYNEDNKITDLLYLCKTHIEHNLPYEQVFQVICDRFTAMAINLGTKVDLTKEFSVIIDHLRKGASTDYIVSRGEYLNAIITAAYLSFDFVDAAAMVHFDEKGRFLSEETNESIKKELSKHETAVIPGFYGSMPNGDIKTFSRGGSDITGAIVARALEADVYENWTDVSGFLMADPKIIPDARPIKRISYKELRELSYMGASVLHEDAIYPVKIANIPINIKNTNIPDDPGTLITSQEENTDGRIVTGIAGSKDFTVIALYKNMLSSEKGFVRRVLAIFEDYDVLVEHMPSGIDTLSVVVSSSLVDGKLDDILEEISRKLQPDTIDVFENMALVATVGYGMSRRPGVSAKLFTALADAGVNIRMIDQGSSEMNIIVGVENKDLNTTIKAIYRAFVSPL